MNCCDSFGNCNQGRECPVRKSRALRAEIDAQEEPEFNYMREIARDVLMLIGLFAVTAVAAFAWGYWR